MRFKVFAATLAVAVGAGLAIQAPAHAAAPGAPTNVLATVASSTSATVTWDPVVSVPAATGYTVTSNPGSKTCTDDSVAPLQCDVSGLTTGTTYTFTVTATNTDGTGPASTPSNPVTPAAVPNAPTLLTVTSGVTEAWVDWSAPSSSNGSALLGYGVYFVYDNAGTPTTIQPCGAAPLALTPTECTATALNSGTTYTVYVTAINSIGASAASNVIIANPAANAGVPAAPTAVSAVNDGPTSGGVGTATITWAAPPVIPGFPVTAYDVTPAGGAGTCAQSTPVPPATFAAATTTCSGLVEGTEYTFTVTATNDNGTSAASSASNAITPYPAADVPAAPASITIVAGPEQVVLTWSQPSSPSAILGYQVNYVTPAGVAGTTACTTVSALTCTVTGLTAGTSYSFKVRARNSVGWGEFSPTSAAATPLPASTPSAPRTVTATAGAGSATVTWAAPISDGGSAITSYTVTGSPGGTCTVAALTCTISGLTAGTSYTFTVQARNVNGLGTASAPSNAVVPTASLPNAPTGLTGTPGNGLVNLSWAAPMLGAPAPTSYVVRYSSNGGSTWSTPVSTGSAALAYTVAGLTNGTAYVFQVAGVNGAGTGPWSASSVAVTPTGAVPNAPTGLTGTAGDRQVVLTWAAPLLGAPVPTGYQVQYSSNNGATWSSPLSTNSNSLTYTVTGLTNGTAYVFQVRGVNAAGNGAWSTSSAAVTPSARVPGAPTAVRAVAGDARADVTWAAPVETGGQAITGYTVTAVPGGATCSTAGTLSCTVTGLTNGQAYVFQVTARNATGVGPASAISNEVTPVSARSILIEGTRGTGSEDNMIFVDGITEGLVGKTVTPYFRFPGQSGFTAGTGTRTVDANGDFAWQRKTGKRIVVEFRGDGITSNRIVIQAK